MHGRLLIVVRSVWAMFAVFALTIFVFSIPIYANLLQTLCSGSACASGQLSPAAAHSLQPLHISFLLFPDCEYFTLTLIPLALGMAILRYRLYDIDIIINRTLVYGSPTAILALLYFGLVFLLQTLLNPLAHNTALSIVSSTLVIAAHFLCFRSLLISVYCLSYDRLRAVA